MYYKPGHRFILLLDQPYPLVLGVKKYPVLDWYVELNQVDIDKLSDQEQRRLEEERERQRAEEREAVRRRLEELEREIEGDREEEVEPEVPVIPIPPPVLPPAMAAPAGFGDSIQIRDLPKFSGEDKENPV